MKRSNLDITARDPKHAHASVSMAPSRRRRRGISLVGQAFLPDGAVCPGQECQARVPDLHALTVWAGGRRRRGISLLEVLISMFVLLIGLVGVGAMIPAGKFEILQGVKIDYASMLGRAAFRDLKTRGYLNPNDPVNTSNWIAPGPSNVWTGSSPNPFTNPLTNNPVPSVAVAIDPLGCGAGFTKTFPFGGAAATSLARIYTSQTATSPGRAPSAILADPIFRCSSDLNLLPGAGKDLPPLQQMMGGGSKRSSVGNYSWLATIVPDPNPAVLATSTKMIVSVAVIYKRDLSTAGAGESTATATPNGGGEVTLSSFTASPIRPVRPGQWIMLAYTANGSNFRWFRVVAADVVTGTGATAQQYATLAGADLPVGTAATAWIIDNVIAVYEKNMRLELP